jgi:hypothetical protein
MANNPARSGLNTISMSLRAHHTADTNNEWDESLAKRLDRGIDALHVQTIYRGLHLVDIHQAYKNCIYVLIIQPYMTGAASR